MLPFIYEAKQNNALDGEDFSYFYLYYNSWRIYYADHYFRV